MENGTSQPNNPSDLEQAARRALGRYDDPQELHNTQVGGFPRGEVAWAMAADLRPVLGGCEMPIRRADVRAALARLRERIATIELNPLAAEEHAQRLRREDLQKAVDECGRELGVEVRRND
jgi:hypothetical protein